MSWKTRHHGHIIKRMGKSVRLNGMLQSVGKREISELLVLF